MTKKPRPYRLKEGMVFEKRYYSNTYKLVVVECDGKTQFQVGHKVFSSMTAAAKHVCNDETRSISGPLFWGNPVS